jgi:acetyl-CoA carboxylase biotin carboxyl carrier protein
MSGSVSNSGEVFDVRRIRRLVELMKEHELAEIDLREGQTRIRLRRAGEAVVTSVEPRPAAPAPPAARPAAAGEPPPAEDKLAVIKSPMVGTFYVASSPESPPFVKVGDHVGPETTVCIIEAMKVFNEIPAETSGKIVAVLVENGEPVEFGQPLFKVDASK